jgi:hypothetical protein
MPVRVGGFGTEYFENNGGLFRAACPLPQKVQFACRSSARSLTQLGLRGGIAGERHW